VITPRRLAILTGLSMSAVATPVALAGTYYAVDLFVGRDPINDPEYVPPFAIVHPVGYTGSGGTIEVKVCVVAGDEELIPPLDAAIALWNRLLPTIGNCIGCGTHENPPPPVNQVNVMTVLFHELGHCALGLDHPNHREFTSNPTRWQTGECDVDSDSVCGEESSFTASVNATEITSSAGTPRGDGEDVHENQCPSIPSLLPPVSATASTADVTTAEMLLDQDLACLLGGMCASPPNCCPPCPGPSCPTVPMQVQHFSYYRRSDNNPVVIDGTVIDMATFSRAPGNLPPGSTYAANANLDVAAALGYSNTQSVMYSGFATGQQHIGPAADDVNMVRMGMTGVNRTAGDGDDYTVVLTRVSDCSQADVSVEFSIFLPAGEHGLCFAGRPVPSFPQSPPIFHWTMTKEAMLPRLEIEVNEFSPLDYSIPFGSGFETGDFSEWSEIVQPPP
jgi:hypothetical protein